MLMAHIFLIHFSLIFFVDPSDLATFFIRVSTDVEGYPPCSNDETIFLIHPIYWSLYARSRQYQLIVKR
jgi:hypothetical protein